MKTSLDFSQAALDAAPDQNIYQFNVAFVRMQIAQLIYTLQETVRTLAEVETASAGLDAAIESLLEIAKSSNPPFPRHDIEQRANMGRNTMRKQLERAMQSQRDYEAKNAARLEQARQTRDAEIKKRQDEKRVMEEKIEEQKRKLREERERMMEEDRLIAEAKAEEEKSREQADYTTDEETGERKKREKKRGGGGAGKRKKKGEESDTDPDGDEDADYGGGGGKKGRDRSASGTRSVDGEDGEESARPKKKKRRKLERKGKGASSSAAVSKFKSDEKIIDSDSDDAGVERQNENARLARKLRRGPQAEDPDSPPADGELETGAGQDDDDEDAVVERTRRPKKSTRVVDEDEDDEDDDDAGAAVNGNGDVSMVDESGPAAGNEDALDS